jgi:hypothetical protein
MNFETLERLDEQSIRRLKRSAIGLPQIANGTAYNRKNSANPLPTENMLEISCPNSAQQTIDPETNYDLLPFKQDSINSQDRAESMYRNQKGIHATSIQEIKNPDFSILDESINNESIEDMMSQPRTEIPVSQYCNNPKVLKIMQ